MGKSRNNNRNGNTGGNTPANNEANASEVEVVEETQTEEVVTDETTVQPTGEENTSEESKEETQTEETSEEETDSEVAKGEDDVTGDGEESKDESTEVEESEESKDETSEEQSAPTQPTGSTPPAPAKKEEVLWSVEEVAAYLKRPGIKVTDKLATIAEKSQTNIRTLVSKLITYNQELGKNAPDKGMVFVASKNYDLYNSLKQTIETKDTALFTVKMDIINLAFKVYSDDAFNEFALHRADTSWKWGDKALVTYQNLVTMISMLADLSKREKNKKSLVTSKVLNIKEITLSQAGIDNIKKYYSL